MIGERPVFFGKGSVRHEIISDYFINFEAMKNVVFDLGGVVFHRDAKKVRRELIDFFAFIFASKMPAFLGGIRSWSSHFRRGARRTE